MLGGPFRDFLILADEFHFRQELARKNNMGLHYAALLVGEGASCHCDLIEFRRIKQRAGAAV